MIKLLARIRQKHEDKKFEVEFSQLLAFKKRLQEALHGELELLRQGYENERQGLTPGTTASKEALYQYKKECALVERKIYQFYADERKEREAFLKNYMQQHCIGLRKAPELVMKHAQEQFLKDAMQDRKNLDCNHLEVCRRIAAYKDLSPWHCMQCVHYQDGLDTMVHH
ncbi:MAG: hypothetical protein HQM07_03055 [Zetaproteobacteria bacterium]|nr:hypothetical protein [Zetaproteobacteria bacterium]